MENTLIDGRYLLLAAIGAGGEARVFRARDQAMESDVAVRIALHPRSRATSGQPPAHHAAWVRLLSEGSDPQAGAYQVFELLEGQTLGQSVEAGPFDPGDWRAFVDQSLDAVEALHVAGWPHGDLNADNFFRTASGWKLLELPFLRFDPPENRSPLFGSIYTLAPEQINGARPDTLSDLYALGCLCYLAASGVYPHTGATDVQVAISCLRSVPDPLREKAPALPAAWSDWVMKLISVESTKRPPTVAAARQLLGVA